MGMSVTCLYQVTQCQWNRTALRTLGGLCGQRHRLVHREFAVHLHPTRILIREHISRPPGEVRRLRDEIHLSHLQEEVSLLKETLICQ